MKAFQALFDQLDSIKSTRAKVSLLADYFRRVPSADSAWALSLLVGKRRRRLITGRRLRDILRDQGGMPEWLISDCYAQVGDSAETISLLWPAVKDQIKCCESILPNIHADHPLHWWMETLLPAIAGQEAATQSQAVLQLWRTIPESQHFIANKLLTGGFRVGVSTGFVSRAVAEAFELDEDLVVQRLMGGFIPSAANFEQLTATISTQEQHCSGKPYPFFLASPLDPAKLITTTPNKWMLEWKWDGIRGQLIQRGGSVYLWSRGEELVNDTFPEIVNLGTALPEGTVLDGELICWKENENQPLGFDQLQRRLGRKQVGKLLKQDCPVRFIAYDLLENEGKDCRHQPLHKRIQTLTKLINETNHKEKWRLMKSSSWRLDDLSSLDQQRQRAKTFKAEGLMLKHTDSAYLSGRKRGYWWKYKLEPMTLDAVLIYAQAGSGRRANLFTDYTFGLWNGEKDSKLVSFAKAYSGLNDTEIVELDKWIRKNTVERYGPTRAVKQELVFEIAFEGIHPSKRHKSGLAVRFPRILRWRRDKLGKDADQIKTAEKLIEV